ncbi:hypothetical protein F2Q70_00032730 [Brassica cretica]|uniref:Uncharacterized protein n=1 Tax=Brassica cretica TaxID=69181 RepID=A0A8S9FJ43_BRACR|nr:hypothetical protein F2Q70_00032730 [Brassica cretica]KAF2539819.1 hypothetical protein F2Q68_00019168 [Brassica cretica]
MCLLNAVYSAREWQVAQRSSLISTSVRQSTYLLISIPSGTLFLNSDAAGSRETSTTGLGWVF